MTAGLLFLFLVIFIAFIFDFINGFHDAANSIATVVATGVLSPRVAVLWAAFFNFIAFLFFKLSVANTIGTGLIDPNVVDTYLIFAALMGAILWNLGTWYFGLPSSSSHALIGGLAGAALASAGFSSLVISGFVKVLTAIIVSPLMGLALAYILIMLITKLTHRLSENTKNNFFKKLQFVSAAALSLSHGGNDAQKTMGIIAGLMFSASLLGDTFYVPFWVVISCNFVIALGTLAGGWRIVHTMGKKITPLNPMRGACAETGAAATIFFATDLGIPVSTTHTITGAITGVGLSKEAKGADWSVIRKIVYAWVLTLPATALIAASFVFVKRLIG